MLQARSQIYLDFYAKIENIWINAFKFIAACLVEMDIGSFYHDLPKKDTNEMARAIGKVWGHDISSTDAWQPKLPVPKLGYTEFVLDKSIRSMQDFRKEYKHVIGSILFLFYSKCDKEMEDEFRKVLYSFKLASPDQMETVIKEDSASFILPVAPTESNIRQNDLSKLLIFVFFQNNIKS